MPVPVIPALRRQKQDLYPVVSSFLGHPRLDHPRLHRRSCLKESKNKEAEQRL